MLHLKRDAVPIVGAAYAVNLIMHTDNGTMTRLERIQAPQLVIIQRILKEERRLNIEASVRKLSTQTK